MQTYWTRRRAPRHPCVCGPLRAICTTQRPCLPSLPLPSFAATPELHQECTMPRLTPAGSPPAVYLADRSRPVPASDLHQRPPGHCAPWSPVMRLANGAWPSSPRQATCRATLCPAEQRQRLAPLAFSPLPPPALPPRHRFATAPLMANPAIRGLRLAAGYRVLAWADLAPAFPGCWARLHCVARFRLARLPSTRPRWGPQVGAGGTAICG